MQTIDVPIAQLKFSDYNPRSMNAHDFEALKRSLREFGWVEPVVVNTFPGRENVIVGGHQRVRAAQALGTPAVPVVFIHVPPAQEKLLNLALNRISGQWDEERLSELIRLISEETDGDIFLSGFTDQELSALLSEGLANKRREVDADAVPEVPEQPVSRPGELYELGPHRILCGDTTKPEDVDRLLNGQKAKLAVTSPPYGVGKEYEEKGIDAWLAAIKPAVAQICRVSEAVVWNIGDLYATGSQFIEPTFAYSILMFKEQGLQPMWIRIWLKQGMNFGVGPYHLVSHKPVQQYEYLAAFGQDPGAVTLEDLADFEYLMAFSRGREKFVKRLTPIQRKQWGYAGVWPIKTVTANKEHPAMFPAELPRRGLMMHTDPGDLVFDPFMGSGTTLIAAEQLQRRCVGMEREPRYVDVIRDRYARFVGKPELAAHPERLKEG